MFLTKMSNILIFLSLTLFQCIICKYSLYCKCYKTRRWKIDEKKIAHTGLILAIGTSMLGHESIVKVQKVINKLRMKLIVVMLVLILIPKNVKIVVITSMKIINLIPKIQLN